MSIVHYAPELPKEGAEVYADGKPVSDRCYYEDGKFQSPGDFPMKPFEVREVTRWFYWDEYRDKMDNKYAGQNGWTVSFKEAETLIMD